MKCVNSETDRIKKVGCVEVVSSYSVYCGVTIVLHLRREIDFVYPNVRIILILTNLFF